MLTVARMITVSSCNLPASSSGQKIAVLAPFGDIDPCEGPLPMVLDFDVTRAWSCRPQRTVQTCALLGGSKVDLTPAPPCSDSRVSSP